MIKKTRRLRRKEASAYLLDEWGISRTPKTLAKLATTGGGPPFEKDGRFPLYTPPVLDAWARSKLSSLVDSTAELAQQKSAAAVGRKDPGPEAKVIPEEDCLVDAYRRALEQAFVQQKIDEVIDEAEKLGEDAEIPTGLRAKVEERLDKDSAATWDEIVRNLAVQDIDDDDVGDDE